MKKLSDYLKQGTDADVAQNLAKAAKRVRELAGMIPTGPVNDYLGFAAQRILLYVARETEGASSEVHKDIQYFAWRTRNIFEAYLLLKYCLASSQKAEAFLAQRIGDERTILEGALGLVHEESTGDTSPVQERIENCNAVLAKYGFTKALPWRTDMLADAVALKLDYDAFYKLYSKYVHPSSWVIIAERDEVEAPHLWEAFIVNCQLYSYGCCGEAEQFLAAKGVSTAATTQHPGGTGH